MSLLSHPLWQSSSLGSPLPPSEFGVSVSLPLWEHVIGYEEGDQRVTSQFRSGYPRFFLPPQISNLFAAAERALAQEGERCIVFPRFCHAQRCKQWVDRHGGSARLATFTADELGVCIVPAAHYDIARKFWRFSGEVVSARQSLHALGRDLSVTIEQGDAALATLRQRLAALSGQGEEDVFFFPSGMAATFTVHRMLSALRPGKKSVQLGFPYVDVLKVQQHFGAGVHDLPVLNETSYTQLEHLAATEPLSAIFAEAPTNPLLQCPDFSRLPKNVTLVLDDTIGTVINVDAFRVADIVTTSLTKNFSGEGDVLAGSVILNRRSPHYAAFSSWMLEHHEHTLFRADAVALEQNSRNFAERVATMTRNSIGLYHHLARHPKIGRLWHSINEGGPGYQFLQRHPEAHSPLFSLTLKDASRAPAYYDALEVCKGPSLGTDFTLVCPYTLLAHYDELDRVASCGVPRDLIRVSTGIEPLADLIGRFDRALAVV